MIKTMLDFIEKIYDKKYKEIEQYLNVVTHPVTVGNMYEGLTKSIVKSAFGSIPELHICEGFIKNYRTGQISRQTDVIIYTGQCDKIPETDSKIINIDNVLAFIEVKKTLRKKELADFYQKQGEIYELSDSETPYDAELFHQLTKQVFGINELNDENIKNYPKLYYYLYHVLKVENASPLRICLGYDGIKKETTLRDNFESVIYDRNKDNLSHTGMNSLPSLIICNDLCLIKAIGFPVACLCEKNKPYPIMLSQKCNTMKLLLQVLISKIESKMDVRFELENDDFSKNSFNDFLLANIDEEKDYTIYYKYDYDAKELSENDGKEIPWSPIEITDYEHLIINKLAKLSYVENPMIRLDNNIFKGHNLKVELSNLLNNRFVSIHDDVVELVSTECMTVIWDGKFWLGENCSGQMMNWILRIRSKNS